MRRVVAIIFLLALCGLAAVAHQLGAGGHPGGGQRGRGNAPDPNDPINKLVGRLDLEKYKTLIKDLTAYGDRRAGTDRNRAAIDWIESQLKSSGCTNTERLKYGFPMEGRANT